MPLKKISFSLKAPFGEIGGEWDVDRAEETAAWEMYVELATRISVVPLGADDGLLREALTSFYSLFATTREILRRHGPGIAKFPRTADDHDKYSFGYIAAWVLNGAVRPLVARWHPLLEDWETQRAGSTSRREHEKAWPRHDELRAEIQAIQTVLNNYAWLLAEACGAPGLMVANAEINPTTTAT